MDFDPNIHGTPICNDRFLIQDYGDYYLDITFIDGIVQGGPDHHIVCESPVGKVTSIADDPLDANYDSFSGSGFPGKLRLEKNWRIDGAADMTVANVEELEALMSRAVCTDGPSVVKERLDGMKRQIALLRRGR